MRRLISIFSFGRSKTPPKKKQNRKAQRRRVVPQWRRPALYAAAFLSVFGSAVGGAYWAWTSGEISRIADQARTAVIDATVQAGLSVGDILVEGRTETSRALLLAAIDVNRNDPMLTIDTDSIRERLLTLGWVADAVVQRQLPDTLYIRIVERKAMAIWQRNGKFLLVDASGAVIGTQGLERHTHLKVIVGDAAPEHAPELLIMMSTAPKLMQRVRAGVWVGGRRWNLRLDDGIDIRLPEAEPHAAWERLVALERNRQLLNRDITAIDLRFGDRLVVQRRDPGNNT